MTLPVRPPSSAAGGGAPAARSPRRIEPSSRSAVTGEEHPGEGDVLELAQVAELVVDGQAPLPRPAERLADSPCAIQHPRPQRRDRPHVRGEVADVDGARPRRAGRARRPGRPRPRGSGPSRPASDSGFCGRPACSPSSLAAQQVLRAASRSLRSRRTRSARRACPPSPAAPARAARRELAGLARRCASPRRGGPARSACRPARSSSPRTSATCPARSRLAMASA